jgi:hypothetical protein
MSQYDAYHQTTYKFSAVDFSTGSSKKLPVPRGATFARVLDIMVVASVLFTQVTTPAIVQIGDGTTADKFASITLGALAAGSSITGNDVAHVWNANYLAGNYPPSGLHDLTATFVAPTGGTPAGTGDVYILVGYDKISN